jgi:hypothetical protein
VSFRANISSGICAGAFHALAVKANRKCDLLACWLRPTAVKLLSKGHAYFESARFFVAISLRLAIEPHEPR